jgi:pimeloyl-ACP methyl ester carboxylesterase
VDVGGYHLVLYDRGIGTPTVVLEAGGGLGSDTWDAVWTPLSRLSRVVRYDRAGRGASEAAPTPRTYADMVADLHSLLQRSAIAPSYVLVGHSMGGLLVRLYAQQYPDEVAGLVLIDAVHPDQNRRAFALLPPEQADESMELATLRRNLTLVQSAARIPDDPEQIDFPRSEEQARGLGMLGGLPLVVLTQGQSQPADLPADVAADFAAYIRDRYHPMFLDLQDELAGLSTQSCHLMARHSGHMIHQDEPALVITAIRDVLRLARRPT